MDTSPKISRERISELMFSLSSYIPEEFEEFKLLVVGGALMMYNGDRESTYDIDVLSLEKGGSLSVIGRGILEVAKKFNLPPDWLNFDVENLGFDVEGMEYSLIAELGKIKLYGVSDLTLLVMKSFAMCERYGGDEEDIILIMERMKSVSIDKVVAVAERIRPDHYFDVELVSDVINTYSSVKEGNYIWKY